MSPGTCTGVKFTPLTCSVLNMAYFDIFNELKCTTEDGMIRQNYEERIDGMVLGDRLKQIMVMEEYDDPDAYDAIHEAKYDKEFIFNLFKHISLGGGVCQYENNIGEYLKVVKALYKDLVVVAKDGDTQEVKCFSQAFRIDSIEGYENKLWQGKDGEHP